MEAQVTGARGLQREVMLFSFGWLTAANLVGLLLSLLLLFPGLGSLLGPVTYGRLMPLHMEWHLYGWCSLPLVGLLLREFIRSGPDLRSNRRFALSAWSLGLLVGGAGFLTAHASGKLFLSWSGLSRTFFPVALCLVWSVLATHWIRNLNDDGLSRSRKAAQAVLLLVLATIPFALYFSSSRSVYPPVNPSSGGATGHSLLASTLGLVGVFAATPMLLGLRRRSSAAFRWLWLVYTGLWILYLFIHHGNASNHEMNQVIGLGSLLLLVPFLWAYLNIWSWPAGALPWLKAFIFWWALLTLNGWVTFLPGVLDRLKFTNALVAHAHLAMAGMVTAFSFILFSALETGRAQTGGEALGGRAGFIAWNSACLVMVVILFLQGWREGAEPEVVFGRDGWTTFNYTIRALAGLVMFGAGAAWFWKAFKGVEKR